MSELLKACPLCGGEVRVSIYDALLHCSLRECEFDFKNGRLDADIADFNTRHNELYWTKEPPTEKDLGKWFLVRRVIHDDDSGLDYTKVEILKLQIWAEFGLVFNYLEVTKWSEDIQAEFLGPLPE